MNSKKELINKSIGAALLISLGDYALLKLGNPLGPFLFSLGLLGVCYMNQNLFTGKCGFLIEDRIGLVKLFAILSINLIAGYLFGLLYSFVDREVCDSALQKVISWDLSFSFFVKSLLCGVIMYVAVYMYRKKTSLGIIFGIPLFILCGFQHCIANIITLGITRSFDLSILICILGNFVGSLFMWYVSKDYVKKD